MATAMLGPTARADRTAAKLTGWAVFSGVVLLVAGGFNLINGYTALQNADFFKSQIVYSNLTFWGWAFFVWGALQITSGVAVLSHQTWGNFLGVFLAAIAAILWFFMIFAAPWAALLGVAVSLMVVYGLTAGASAETY